MNKISATLHRLAAVFAVLAIISAVGCSKQQKPEDESAIPTAPSADENAAGDSDSGKAMGLVTVYFPYDSFTLDSEGKAALKANAQILKDKTSVRVQLEGHCDQRGGIQYNIALGEKRANAAKKFLVDQGIAEDRISTISFGKERPLDPAMTEEAFAKNRRVNFVITTR